MTERTIVVKNTGPVEDFILPAPRGKVVLLKGHNGAGKSTVLEAVQVLTTGRGNVTVRDRAPRGEVSGFETVLRVARRISRTGLALDELEISSLESRFDVSTLVNPGIKAPDAADVQRIKALVQLAGALADPALFYHLVGGSQQFNDYVAAASVETNDLVLMAARIKRDLEKHAREAADKADKETKAAAAARLLTVDVDLNAKCDGDELQQDLEFAFKEHSRLTAEANSISATLLNATTAREQLEKAEASHVGVSLEQAVAAEAETSKALDRANGEVERLRGELAKAQAEAQQATLRHDNALNTWQAATNHENTIAGWRATIDAAASVQPIPAELLQAAEYDVTIARRAVEQGAIVRKAKESSEKAAAHMQSAAEWSQISDHLRDAAKGTDDVLSDVVQKLGCPLRVAAGRLVTETKRGETFFGELSDGERWKLALDIAIEAVGPNGVLTIEQNAWQDLDPTNQQLIINRVAETDCTLFTAQCADGELRAEVL